ncbi:MAG: hypothetical protein JAZ11_02945 [Candidatus Thiodiazotropha lotti]|nr:hypothetical protein [Candidatus Thiodiazotropha lotti]
MNNEKTMHVANKPDDQDLILYDHMERLESRYAAQMEKLRIMASSWFLATAAAMTLILTRGGNIDIIPDANGNLIDRALIASFVCFIGAIAIYMLWILDSRVYRPLLASIWLFAMRFEQEKGIAPIRQTITAHSKTKDFGIIRTITKFYAVLGALLLFCFNLLIASVLLVYAAGADNNYFFIFSFIILFIAFSSIRITTYLNDKCSEFNWNTLKDINPEHQVDVQLYPVGQND